VLCEMKYAHVWDEWLPNHVETCVPHDVEHIHFPSDFTGESDIPTTAEVDDYWDWRFCEGVEGKCTRVEGEHATNVHNCVSWAFKNRQDGGEYNFWVWVPGQALWDDVDDQTGNIMPDDFLFYTGFHLSVVEHITPGCGGGAPDKLIWKCADSALYTYEPTYARACATPLNTLPGNPDPDKIMAEQDWTWNWYNWANPSIFTDN